MDVASNPPYSTIYFKMLHHQIMTQTVTPSLVNYWNLCLTQDGNQNRHTRNLVQHTEISLSMLATQCMTYPQRCLRQITGDVFIPSDGLCQMQGNIDCSRQSRPSRDKSHGHNNGFHLFRSSKYPLSHYNKWPISAFLSR